MFKGTLSKLVKNRKLNYAHARKSLAVASSKELIVILGKVNLYIPSLIKIGREMGALSWTQPKSAEPEVIWRACVCLLYFRCCWPSNLVFVVECVTHFPNSRNIAQKLRSPSWTICISGRHTQSDRQTYRQTDTQVILYLSNVKHCIGQSWSPW